MKTIGLKQKKPPTETFKQNNLLIISDYFLSFL